MGKGEKSDSKAKRQCTEEAVELVSRASQAQPKRRFPRSLPVNPEIYPDTSDYQIIKPKYLETQEAQ